MACLEDVRARVELSARAFAATLANWILGRLAAEEPDQQQLRFDFNFSGSCGSSAATRLAEQQFAAAEADLRALSSTLRALLSVAPNAVSPGNATACDWAIARLRQGSGVAMRSMSLALGQAGEPNPVTANSDSGARRISRAGVNASGDGGEAGAREHADSALVSRAGTAGGGAGAGLRIRCGSSVVVQAGGGGGGGISNASGGDISAGGGGGAGVVIFPYPHPCTQTYARTRTQRPAGAAADEALSFGGGCGGGSSAGVAFGCSADRGCGSLPMKQVAAGAARAMAAVRRCRDDGKAVIVEGGGGGGTEWCWA